LPGAPTEVRVDSDLGLLYVAIPERQALMQVDIRSGKPLRTISDVPQVTSLALDPTRHVLYAGHLGGQVTVVDVATAQVIARPSLTGVGLASVATARGLVYGVNTVTHELAVLEPSSESVSRFGLSAEPAAVTAAEDSGAVYVLTSRSDSILRIDPTDGSELGKVIVSNRSGHVGTQPNDVTSLRPRLVLDPADDTMFATLPEAGTLAAVTDDSFPAMAHDIPYADVGDVLVAQSIPDVLRPGGVGGDRINAQGH